ncbi:hypothetical protein FE785_02455 [Thiomicrorhabdus sediminis]|uniref:Cds6 C-terminal domain-containing protein n=2 Tax=Thiomicrorhabdus sediminis TaxID=2580412 RepID=A0A4P9K5N4_9GAMM|nr:hypothetical protein FE785_02455 [Thiomicrorhabdus sediminis]
MLSSPSRVSSMLRVSQKPLHLKLIIALFALLFSAPNYAQQNLANDKSPVQELKRQADIFQLGLQAMERNNRDEALALWSQLAESGELIPELARAVENNIAVVLIQQKRYDEAKKRLDRALESNPQVATTLANLNQIYAYEAQKAYKQVFKDSKVIEPTAQLLYFDIKSAQLPNQQVVIKAENADGMRVVKKQVELWRQAWASQNVERYLSFYDDKAFIPKNGWSLDYWIKNRHISLKRPDYIKVYVDELTLTPISDDFIRARFYQRYDSDRFKDDVYKVLLWQKHNNQWKIVQEVVMYDGK